MKDYKQYNHEEIEAIATKITNGEFVYPAGKEMAKWYDYKRDVKFHISDCEKYLKKVYSHKDHDKISEITKEVENDLQEAKNELAWIRSIKTYDLEAFCEFYCLSHDDTDAHCNPNFIWQMADRIVNGDATEEQKQFTRELFEETNYFDQVLTFKKMTLPIAQRRWGHVYRRPTEYCPFDNVPEDAPYLYDGRKHYIYIESECEAKWGNSYWISVDCMNGLHSLPVIKAFQEYEFEVGKFYEIECTDVIHWGNNKKKYVMEISETDEATFLEKGLRQYATRC